MRLFRGRGEALLCTESPSSPPATHYPRRPRSPTRPPQHPALTNCLVCGRISCEFEGYDFCCFCGYYVSEPPSSAGSESAKPNASGKKQNKYTPEQHKDRLLRFDRESASRTEIFDDQADYFTNTTSQWLTLDEQADNAEKEEKRREALHVKQRAVTINLSSNGTVS